MSTRPAENINANGSMLTAALVREGFRLFPQSVAAWLNPAQWPAIAPIQFSVDYPFIAHEDEVVPAGEVWFMGNKGELLGRIINLSDSAWTP